MSSKKTGISGAIAPLPPSNEKWWKEEMTPTSTGQTEWIRIAVVSYHTDLDREVPDEVQTVAVWQHWPVVAAFEDVLQQEVKNLRGGEATARHIIREAYAVATQGYDVKPRELPVTAEGGTGISLYMVQGPTATVRKYVYEFLNNVAMDSDQVSGDDDYFDYYPDRVYCAAQLCVALGMEEEYKEAYAHILKRYKDLEPDVLSTWDETKPKEA
jgi:hypothetical protein